MERYIFVSRRERRNCCTVCGEVLFPGEVYYDLGGVDLCVPCMQLRLRRMLRPHRRQVPFAEVAE